MKGILATHKKPTRIKNSLKPTGAITPFLLGLLIFSQLLTGSAAAFSQVNSPAGNSIPLGQAAPAAVFLPIVKNDWVWDPDDLRPVVFRFSQVVSPLPDTRQLAVAFHSVTFLDPADNTIGTLFFGTSRTNQLQEQGWFGNETWSGVGSFQWAGGEGKMASMNLPIPENAEGMLIFINASIPGIWMDVSIDGKPFASLRVDDYWHSGYVPLEKQPTQIAAKRPPLWTSGRYFPCFSAADRLYAIRVRTPLEDHPVSWTPDWRIDDSHDAMMALTLVGMQGVINRNGASLYLVWDDPWGKNQFWMPELDKHADVLYLDMDGLSAFTFLMRRFSSRFNGAVLYDPQVPETINLATMIAGLEDRLILAQEQLTLPGITSFTPGEVSDLVALAAAQGWDASEGSKVDIYTWAYENLWPDLEHRMIGIISAGPPTSRAIPPECSGYYFPISLAARDYIVALRLSALWLSPPDPSEDYPEPCPPYNDPSEKSTQEALFTTFLDEAPSPIPVFGFYGNEEAGTVALASEHGDWVASITNSNAPLSGGNPTVFSSLRPPLEDYQLELDTDRMFATLGEAPVLTIWDSDGDNLDFQIERGFHGGVNFIWEDVQDHRFGWSTNPTLGEIAPLIWNYYVTQRSEVSFTSALSGNGYMYPQLMDAGQLTDYLAYAARYLDDTNLRTLHVSTRFGSWDDVAQTYYDNLAASEFLGSFLGWAGFPYGQGFYYADVPTPGVWPSYVMDADNSGEILADLLARQSDQVLVDPGLYDHTEGWHRGEIISDTAASGGETLYFSPDFCVNANCLGIWGPRAILPPGDYTVTFHLKVTDNQSASSLAQLFVGRLDGTTWNFLASRYISPSDFTQSGVYQDFNVSFSLDQVTTGIEFRIDDYSGPSPPPGVWATTGLYVDTIHSTRQGGLDMPVFAAAFIHLMGPNLGDTPKLADDLEAAGGLVLHPDEFMAALNPEFMISWAETYLGASHPDLATARTQLTDGKYFQSLMTVRGALQSLPQRTFTIDPFPGCTVAVTANTWISHIDFDPDQRELSFRTHGPPTGEVQTLVEITAGCLHESLNTDSLNLYIDGQPYPLSVSRDTSTPTDSPAYSIELNFQQGAHFIIISED
jgi:hypothetical protein